MKIAEICIGMWGQFRVEKNESGHNNFCFQVKPIFQGLISEFDDSFPLALLRRKFCDVISPKPGKLLDSTLHQACRLWLYDTCKLSFQSIYANFDFWHWGLCPPPFGPCERHKRPGLTGLKLHIT